MSQTNAQLLADSLGNASTGTVPIGGIILWSGSTGSVPDGWALCNGSNGTPNLQDRFVVGAGSGYAVDATGGSANAVLISHTHGDTFSLTNTKNFGYRESNSSIAVDTIGGENDPGNTAYKKPELSGSVSTKGINAAGNNSNNVTGTNANLPPYYALAYIMRTS